MIDRTYKATEILIKSEKKVSYLKGFFLGFFLAVVLYSSVIAIFEYVIK